MKKKSVFVSGLSALCAIAFLAGCSRMLLLDPKGPIGDAERFVILASFGMLDSFEPIAAAAVMQILVHLHYFLHLDASSAMRWNVRPYC